MLRLLAPRTHNSYRKIPFFGEAEKIFLQQKEKTDQLKKALGDRWRATGEYEDLVFVTTMGSPVLRYHAEKEIEKVVKEINEQEAFESVQEQRELHWFEDMYPHAIRHTFCSRCFEADMQPKVVQSIMGHQHYSTTIDIYTYVSETKYQEEIGKFGRAVEPEEGSGREEPEERVHGRRHSDDIEDNPSFLSLFYRKIWLIRGRYVKIGTVGE